MSGIVSSAYSTLFTVNGRFDFYFQVGADSVSSFSNASGSIEAFSDLGGKVLMRSSSLLTPLLNTNPWPLAVGSEWSNWLEIELSRPEDIAYLSNTAFGIVGDAATMAKAVDRIGFWMRDHVSYSLGASPEPVAVLKTGRAYCEGYANAAAHLLRMVGIPARVLSCYVPPDCGWGFGNSGGRHAFIEYYIPGCGWNSMDPQNSLNFAPAYHLVNMPENVRGDYRSDDVYITDLDASLKYQQYYSRDTGKPNLHPAFVFRFRDIQGKINSQPSIYMTSYGSMGAPPYGTTYSSYDGFEYKSDGSLSFLVYSRHSRFFSFIDEREKFPMKKDEILTVGLGNQLFITNFSRKGIEKYLFDIDFQDNDVKKLVFLDSNDNVLPLSNLRLQVQDDSGNPVILPEDPSGIQLKPDRKGAVYLKTSFSRFRVTAGDSAWDVTLAPGASLRLPPGLSGSPEFFSALPAGLTNAASARCSFFAGLYDEGGVVSAKAFDSVTLYCREEAPQALKVSPLGFVWYDRCVSNRDYAVVFASDNRYLRKNLRFSGPAITNLSVSLKDSVFVTVDHGDNPFRTDFRFYEYGGGKWVIPYQPLSGRVRFGFPEGVYFIADNDQSKGIRKLALSAKSGNFTYRKRPEAANIEDYREIQELLKRSTNLICGAVDLDGTGSVKPPVYLLSRSGGGMKAYPVDSDGFFVITDTKPAEEYRLAFSNGGSFAVKNLPADRASNFSFRLTQGLKRFEVPASNRNFSLFLPSGAALGDKINCPGFSFSAPSSFFGDNAGLQPFTLYLDDGKYLLSESSNAYLSRPLNVPADLAVGLRWGRPPDAESIAAVCELISPGLTDRQAVVFGTVSWESNAARNSTVILADRYRVPIREYPVDGNGYFAFGGLTAGDYQMVYREEGMYFSKPMRVNANGLFSFELKETEFVQLNTSYNSGYSAMDFNLFLPYFKNGKTEFYPFVLRSKYWPPFRFGKSGMPYLACNTANFLDSTFVNGGEKTLTIPRNMMGDFGDIFEYRYEMLKHAYVDSSAVMARLYDRKKQLRTYFSVDVENGQKTTQRVGDDGVLFMQNLKTNTNFTLVFREAGLLLRYSISLTNPGIQKREIRQSELPGVHLNLKNYSYRGFTRLIPYRDAQNRVGYQPENCSLDDKSGFDYYDQPGVYYFQFGNFIQRMALGTKYSTSTIDFKTLETNYFKEFKTIVTELYQGLTPFIVRITKGGIVQKGISLNLDSGPVTSISLNDTGVGFLPDVRTNQLRLGYSDYGYYLEKPVEIQAGQVNACSVDLEKDCGLLLRAVSSKQAGFRRVRIYRDAEMVSNQLKYKSVLTVSADKDGVSRLVLPAGKYYVETGDKKYAKAVVGEKRVTLEF